MQQTLTLNPLAVFAACFVMSALAGLATYCLDLKTPFSFRWVVGVMLSSGLTGLALALCGWGYSSETDAQVYFLVGLSIATGILGTTPGKFLMRVIDRGGIKVNISPGEEK